MTEKMYEELKEALLKAGMEAIDGFLGIPARTTDIEELKQLIEEEFDEMPEEDVKEYYYDVYCQSQNARDFSHEMNDVCNSFSTVSIREP